LARGQQENVFLFAVHSIIYVFDCERRSTRLSSGFVASAAVGGERAIVPGAAVFVARA